MRMNDYDNKERRKAIAARQAAFADTAAVEAAAKLAALPEPTNAAGRKYKAELEAEVARSQQAAISSRAKADEAFEKPAPAMEAEAEQEVSQ